MRGLIEFVPHVGDFLAPDEPVFRLYGGAGSVQIVRRMRSRLENLTQTLAPYRHAELRQQLELLGKRVANPS